MGMVRGNLPIVLTAAQQISVDPTGIMGVVWIPSAVSQSFVLSDNSNDVVAQASLAATGVLAPVVIMFPVPIPVSGLVLKSITTGGTLLVYLADI